jgi:hypothetical protein
VGTLQGTNGGWPWSFRNLQPALGIEQILENAMAASCSGVLDEGDPVGYRFALHVHELARLLPVTFTTACE